MQQEKRGQSTFQRIPKVVLLNLTSLVFSNNFAPWFGNMVDLLSGDLVRTDMLFTILPARFYKSKRALQCPFPTLILYGLVRNLTRFNKNLPSTLDILPSTPDILSSTLNPRQLPRLVHVIQTTKRGNLTPEHIQRM